MGMTAPAWAGASMRSVIAEAPEHHALSHLQPKVMGDRGRLSQLNPTERL